MTRPSDTRPEAVIGVFGGSGRLGRQVLDLAQTAGVAVTSLNRVAPDLVGVDVLLDVGDGGAGLRYPDHDVVDVRPDQDHLRALAARDGGVGRVVAAAGLQAGVGLLLADLAVEASGPPDEVAITYAFPDDGWPLGGASPARRRLAAEELQAPMSVWLDGAHEDEPIAEHRRLAWFPRPVGPRHAAAVPGGEALLLPPRLSSVRTVRTYLALPGWRAEVVQFTVNLARIARARSWLTGRLSRPARRDRAGFAGERRWACVVESHGPRGVARGWAYGRDPDRVTAALALAVAAALRDQPAAATEPHEATRATTSEATDGAEADASRVAGGAAHLLTPGELTRPGRLLDAVAAQTDLRWSLAVPDPDTMDH